MLPLVLCLLAAEPQAIFDGKTLAGWRRYGPRATFAATVGELTTSGLGNYPNWLGTTAEYENFRLHFEYKLAQWAETTVLRRAPEAGRPAQSSLASFLAHDFHKQTSKHVSGSLAGVLPPKNALPESFDVWHRAEILLNGMIVQDVDLAANPELRHRLRRGHIAFQGLGHRAAFRNIRLQNLGDRTHYTHLFNGHSIEEWKLRGAGTFLVRNSALTGENGHGILCAPPVFENFELTAAVRSHNRVNAGIFLRGSPDAVYQTGSIYGLKRSRSVKDFEERWFLMQIHMEDAPVEFRDLRVRKL